MKIKFKKILCLLLSAAVICACFVCASAYDNDDIINAALELIFSHEGTYTSIAANDNGAVSLGRVGWHATRALNLLKTIVNSNKKNAVSVLGNDFVSEILTSADWSGRTFTAEEKLAAEKLLASDESKAAQDALAYEDIGGYITHGRSLGITDGKALVYFADLENQLGSYGAERVAKAAAAASGGAEKVTLDSLYSAAASDSVAGSSPSRRLESYNYCKALNFGSSAPSQTYGTGGYTITASVLRIRSGPGTSYSVAGSVSSGTKVSVTKVSGDWGQISYGGVSGWICLLYAEKDASAQSSSSSVKGDVNLNGKIEASDARLVLRHSARLESFSAKQLSAADFNGDGQITAADARLILKKAAGLA